MRINLVLFRTVFLSVIKIRPGSDMIVILIKRKRVTVTGFRIGLGYHLASERSKINNRNIIGMFAFLCGNKIIFNQCILDIPETSKQNIPILFALVQEKPFFAVCLQFSA